MVGKNFHIYSVQITEKCILWNSSPLGMIWSLVPHVEQSPYKCSLQNMSPMKIMLRDKGRRHHKRVSQNKTENKKN